jgi:hypothetical protein
VHRIGRRGAVLRGANESAQKKDRKEPSPNHPDQPAGVCSHYPRRMREKLCSLDESGRATAYQFRRNAHCAPLRLCAETHSCRRYVRLRQASSLTAAVRWVSSVSLAFRPDY